MQPLPQPQDKRIYPSYMTPRLICLVEEYEGYQRMGKMAPVPIHRRVSYQEHLVLQRYWNEGKRTTSMGQWIKDPFA